jgi:2-polyprenyl-6-methoxyphenol hydroxylase-like FAD-dependent oxidoreductase
MPRQVLVVGAGPTGLVLALWLNRLGIDLRIVDKAPGPGTTSRAMIVHARTLEFYDQLGIAQPAIEAGEKGAALSAHLNHQLIARIPFGDFGKGLSPYPFMMVLPQDAHERLLHEELRKVGIEVEQGTEFISFAVRDDGICVKLKTAGGEEDLTVDYLCGCDGAHSTVREQLGVGFPGGTYQQVFFVADAEVSGAMADDEVHFAFSDDDIFGIFPLKHRTTYRLIGVVPKAVNKDIHEITYDDVAEQVYRDAGLRATRVNWFAAYHVHHRVANSFRQGRAFLLGDASHIHSPAGGQGMNTGIGDAANLAWKLAAVLQRRAATSLLDSYSMERVAVARRIVNRTDRIFSFQVSPSWLMRLGRRWITPLMSGLIRIDSVRRYVFHTISQIGFEYRESALSAGSAGRVHAGDRLPWVNFGAGADNHRVLRGLDWQVHVYGAARDELQRACAATGLSLHVFPWGPAARVAGLKRDAIYLLRPDGHVGLAAATQDADVLKDYLSHLKLLPRVPVAAPTTFGGPTISGNI